MAELYGFNSDEHEDRVPLEPLPSGWYQVAIISSEMKATAAGTGEYLQLQLEVLEGPHKGRKLYDRLNIVNPNETAVEIAKATLATICRAVGVLRPSDSEELHDRPLKALVSLKKREDTGEYKNEVKGYASKDANTSKAAPAQTRNSKAAMAQQAKAHLAGQVGQPAPSKPTAPPPWKKNRQPAAEPAAEPTADQGQAGE